MLDKTKLALFSMGLLSSVTIAQATDLPRQKHIIVAPNCLVKNVSGRLNILSTSQSLALIEATDEDVDRLIAAKTKANQTQPCGGFMDVTDDWNAYRQPKTGTVKLKSNAILKQHQRAISETTTKKFPEEKYAIQYEQQVKAVLNKFNPQLMWSSLSTLTAFQDRYARSDNGVKAAEWLKDQIETMAKGRDDVNAYFVKTGMFFKQPSLVVKFGKEDGPGIVIGAHMDTLSGNKPGADDDGSGTVTVLEVARTLFESGMHFKKPIYFIWYAAEEEGLIGSNYVVRDFKHKNIPVDAVLHLDMTGFAYKNDPTIWLISDYTDKELTKYLETLVNTYVKQPVNYTNCGYACSDHATWHKHGYKSSIPFEAKFGNENHNIHSSRDTMEWLSIDHMTSYAQIGIAFAVELAEPIA